MASVRYRNRKQPARKQSQRFDSPHNTENSYQVFICHHGPETKGIAIELRQMLSSMPLRISAFVDEMDLRGGMVSKAAMEHALLNCQMAVVLFSREFFTSKDCRNELKNIVKWGVEEQRFIYLPVFLFLTVQEVRAKAHDTAGRDWAEQVVSANGIRHKGELYRGRQKTLPETRQQIFRAICDHFEAPGFDDQNNDESDQSDESEADEDEDNAKEQFADALLTGVVMGHMMASETMGGDDRHLRASFPPHSQTTRQRPGHFMSQHTSPTPDLTGRRSPKTDGEPVFRQSRPSMGPRSPDSLNSVFQGISLGPGPDADDSRPYAGIARHRPPAPGVPNRPDRRSVLPPSPASMGGPSRTLQPMPMPANRPGANGQPEVHSNVECDFCEMKPIVGPRYKSTSEENVDACARCQDKIEVQILAGPFVRMRPQN